MVDPSWGAAPAVRDRPDDRADDRTTARAEAMTERMEARATTYKADIARHDQARIVRRQSKAAAAAGDPHAVSAGRRRTSGRKDVVREQRDTCGYATIVDTARICALARRGASITGLTSVFGITPEEVWRTRADAG